jgi:hypothetical protein
LIYPQGAKEERFNVLVVLINDSFKFLMDKECEFLVQKLKKKGRLFFCFYLTKKLVIVR